MCATQWLSLQRVLKLCLAFAHMLMIVISIVHSVGHVALVRYSAGSLLSYSICPSVKWDPNSDDPIACFQSLSPSLLICGWEFCQSSHWSVPVQETQLCMHKILQAPLSVHLDRVLFCQGTLSLPCGSNEGIGACGTAPQECNLVIFTASFVSRSCCKGQPSMDTYQIKMFEWVGIALLLLISPGNHAILECQENSVKLVRDLSESRSRAPDGPKPGNLRPFPLREYNLMESWPWGMTLPFSKALQRFVFWVSPNICWKLPAK